MIPTITPIKTDNDNYKQPYKQTNKRTNEQTNNHLLPDHHDEADDDVGETDQYVGQRHVVVERFLIKCAYGQALIRIVAIKQNRRLHPTLYENPDMLDIIQWNGKVRYVFIV